MENEKLKVIWRSKAQESLQDAFDCIERNNKFVIYKMSHNFQLAKSLKVLIRLMFSQ
jgi:hypothetical protein